MKIPNEIVLPKGRLGVLLVGLGAVSTTFIAGVHAIRKGRASATGALSQIGTIRLGTVSYTHLTLPTILLV